MSEEQKECPHCGSTEGETIAADEDGYCFYWWCSNCKATGPLVVDYKRTDEEEDMDVPAGADVEANPGRVRRLRETPHRKKTTARYPVLLVYPDRPTGHREMD